MRNTLQEQYNLIKEGKGAKDVFVKHAKSLFPHLIPNHYGFDNAAQILTQRNIISENLWGVVTDNDNAQPDWFKIFNESQETNVKADEKKPAKEVEKADEKSYSHQYEAKTGDDVIFDQYLNGIQVEACKSENNGKTVDELKKIVLKNLKKDNLYYTKNAAFGVEGIGYTDEAPGLGKTKEVKGKYASSGMEPVKINEGFNEDKIAKYKKYTYTLDGKTVTPDDIDFYDNLLGAELDGKVYKMGIPDEKGNVELKSAKGKTGMYTESTKTNEGIGMFMDPIGYKKSDPKPQVYTKKFVGISDKIKGDYVYDIFKNGVKVATIDGEGNANAWMNDQQRNMKEANMSGEYIVWIQPEGEEKREHHRAKSKSEAERIARMVYGNYYDDYNPPKIGVVSADEWSQETSLDNMNIKESPTLFRSPIELAKAVANKHGQELKQLKDQGYKVFEPAAIKYGGQTMKDSGMEMVVIKNLLYGYADEDWPSDYINELSNLLKNLNESQLRAAIRQLIKEELNLKEIDTVGEEASKEAKIKKINDEINKRKKKLKALETLKELEEDSVNPKKIKELYSEIKKLEGVSAKLNKKKGEKKEVIDETDTDPNRGTTVLPKSTPPADLKKLNAQGVDVELKELN
jgi:hypothetical protein